MEKIITVRSRVDSVLEAGHWAKGRSQPAPDSLQPVRRDYISSADAEWLVEFDKLPRDVYGAAKRLGVPGNQVRQHEAEILSQCERVAAIFVREDGGEAPPDWTQYRGYVEDETRLRVAGGE